MGCYITCLFKLGILPRGTRNEATKKFENVIFAWGRGYGPAAIVAEWRCACMHFAGNASSFPRFVSLSKTRYHTCFIRGEGCKWWSPRPKLTSFVISDLKPIITWFVCLSLIPTLDQTNTYSVGFNSLAANLRSNRLCLDVAWFSQSLFSVGSNAACDEKKMNRSMSRFMRQMASNSLRQMTSRHFCALASPDLSPQGTTPHLPPPKWNN